MTPVISAGDLVERLNSHMGKADLGEVLRDCRLAAARIQKLEAALRDIATDLQSSIDTHEFNSRHMIAEDSLQDAWKMLDMAREQFQVDANSLRIPLNRARSSLNQDGGKL